MPSTSTSTTTISKQDNVAGIVPWIFVVNDLLEKHPAVRNWFQRTKRDPQTLVDIPDHTIEGLLPFHMRVAESGFLQSIRERRRSRLANRRMSQKRPGRFGRTPQTKAPVPRTGDDGATTNTNTRLSVPRTESRSTG